MRETIASLKERLEKQGMEMLELEMRLDTREAQLLEALSDLARYQRWHLQILQKEE